MNLRLQQKAEALFGFDRRSLALFRISLALLILIDLGYRLPDLKAHYTDFGILPRGPLIEQFLNFRFWSLHLMSGETSIQLLLFGLAALLALLLLVGYQTRWVTILSWVMLVSLQNRNLMIINGGDVEFRLLLFWAMFLPLNDCCSLDRRLQPPKQSPPTRLLSIATVALTLQICNVYWFSALLKTHPMWHQTGEAVYYALSLDHFATPLAHFLLNFPALLTVLTFATLWVERLGPFLLFVPIKTAWFRSAAILLFIGLHIGFRAGLTIGIFPLISAAAWLVFIPSQVWDYCEQRLGIPSAQTPAVFPPSSPRHLPPFLRRLQTLYRTVLQPYAAQLSQGLALMMLIAMIYTNLASIEAWQIQTPRWVERINLTLRTDQRWDMFAPYPMTDDGWFVIPGKLKSGAELDLFRQGAPVRWEKPALASREYPNDHWRKYLINLWGRDNADYRLYYGQYLCRDWNSRHTGDQQLDTFKMYYMLEETQPNYQPSAVEPVLLWEHFCFKAPDSADQPSGE